MNAVWLACVLLFATSARALTRAPEVANRFYPADRKLLDQFLDRAFKSVRPHEARGPLYALIVPHAGVEFSGATAAKAYALLAKGGYDRVLIVGTGHYKALDGAAVYPGDYSTPGFTAPYDRELAEALMKASPLIRADPGAHHKEHSIEVQLPFLQRRLGAFKLTALVMNTQDLDAARQIGRAIAGVVRGKRVLIIASSDMSHYPKGPDADRVDPTTLAALETVDPAYFWLTNRFLLNRGVPDLAVTWCGEGAVTAVLEAALSLGANSADVLGRINSGDVVSERDYRHVVGYSAVALVRAPRGPSWSALGAQDKAFLLRLARRSIADYLAKGAAAPVGLSETPALNLPFAVFVTLTKNGALRGCVGTTTPQESLAEAVARQAVAAAVSDSRFKPVSAAELPGLKIEISVLGPARPLASYKEIKKGDGVTLENGAKSGVFLPDVWKQLQDKTAFLSELCAQKAGLPKDCFKDKETRLKSFSSVVINE